jgi:hypothetical protein
MSEAKRLFVEYTRGTGRIDWLYGPSNASRRADILSALRGVKVPKSKAAWGVFESAMMELHGIASGCTAERHHNLRDAVIASQAVVAE